MLDVDKQPKWECFFKGVVKKTANKNCLRPIKNHNPK